MILGRPQANVCTNMTQLFNLGAIDPRDIFSLKISNHSSFITVIADVFTKGLHSPMFFWMINDGYEYVPMDDKQECSSGSNLVTDDLEGKFVTHSSDKGGLQKPVGRNQQFAAEEIGGSEKQMHSERIRDRRSLDSIVIRDGIQESFFS